MSNLETVSVGATEARRAHRIVQPAEASFAINGRFFSQKVTGVQRYAREIVREMDVLLAAGGRAAELILPPGATASPEAGGLRPVTVGGASGHAWEQAILPFRARTPLLNLCNTAPLALRSQIVCMHDANVFDAPATYSRSFRLAYRACCHASPGGPPS